MPVESRLMDLLSAQIRPCQQESRSHKRDFVKLFFKYPYKKINKKKIMAQLFIAAVLILEKNVVKQGKDKQGQVMLWAFC